MTRFLRLFTYNWQLKLLAFALAVLLWVVVSAEQVNSAPFEVPFQVAVTDPDFRLIESSAPANVTVRFSGPGRELLALAYQHPPLLLRIPDVADTAQVFDLDPGMVLVPAHLSVSAQTVDPARVRLRFQRLSVRSVPVRVRVHGGIASGYTLLDSLSIQPARVDVSGPARLMAGVDSIVTLPISLPSETGAFAEKVPLQTSGLDGLKLSVSHVRVSGRVEKVIDRTLASVPISVGPGIRLRPDRVTVAVHGAEERVKSLKPEDFRVVVAIDSIPGHLPAEGVLVPLRVEGLPRDVRVSVRPQAVRLLPTRLPVDTVPNPRRAGASGDSVQTPPQGGPR